jgi:hypothetical protein
MPDMAKMPKKTIVSDSQRQSERYLLKAKIMIKQPVFHTSNIQRRIDESESFLDTNIFSKSMTSIMFDPLNFCKKDETSRYKQI